MALSLDREIAEALAPMADAMAAAVPPAVGDVAARRAMWEPDHRRRVNGTADTGDVTTGEHQVTAADGAQITMRWYAKQGATPGRAVLFLHGGGCIFGHISALELESGSR